MKKAKKVLCAAFLLSLSSLSIKAENIPGKTRNLNILRLNKHTSVQFSGEENSQNIFRDLACHCDDPNFEMVVALRAKPFAPVTEMEEVLENPLIKPLFLNACKILAPGQDVKDINQLLLRNPKIRSVAMKIYVDYTFNQLENNVEEFLNNNLKELLLSKGSDGKSALDIAREKPDELGCAILREGFEEMAKIIGVQEEGEKQQRLQKEINKHQR